MHIIPLEKLLYYIVFDRIDPMACAGVNNGWISAGTNFTPSNDGTT